MADKLDANNWTLCPTHEVTYFIDGYCNACELDRLRAELADAREKLAEWKTDEQRTIARLKKELLTMQADIRAGEVVVDCFVCSGQGQYTATDRGDPDTALELRCSACDATGAIVYVCKAQ